MTARVPYGNRFFLSASHRWTPCLSLSIGLHDKLKMTDPVQCTALFSSASMWSPYLHNTLVRITARPQKWLSSHRWRGSFPLLFLFPALKVMKRSSSSVQIMGLWFPWDLYIPSPKIRNSHCHCTFEVQRVIDRLWTVAAIPFIECFFFRIEHEELRFLLCN